MLPLLVLSVWVLSSATSADSALSCTQCSSILETCSGPSVTCPSGSLCGTTLTETGTGDISILQFYVKSCLPRDQCDLSGSATSPLGGKVKIGTSCCSTDNCTPNSPSLPKRVLAPNGLTCRSCISADSTWCYTSDTMKCTGDENMCYLQSTKMSGVMTASRGCATKSICNLGSQSYKVQGISKDIKYTCTSGSSGLQKGFLLPAVICLLLLKLQISNI